MLGVESFLIYWYWEVLVAAVLGWLRRRGLKWSSWQFPLCSWLQPQECLVTRDLVTTGDMLPVSRGGKIMSMLPVVVMLLPWVELLSWVTLPHLRQIVFFFFLGLGMLTDFILSWTLLKTLSILSVRGCCILVTIPNIWAGYDNLCFVLDSSSWSDMASYLRFFNEKPKCPIFVCFDCPLLWPEDGIFLHLLMFLMH